MTSRLRGAMHYYSPLEMSGDPEPYCIDCGRTFDEGEERFTDPKMNEVCGKCAPKYGYVPCKGCGCLAQQDDMDDDGCCCVECNFIFKAGEAEYKCEGDR